MNFSQKSIYFSARTSHIMYCIYYLKTFFGRRFNLNGTRWELLILFENSYDAKLFRNTYFMYLLIGSFQ